MSDTVSTPPIPAEIGTTSDERTMAVLAHVLQLVGGWIAPLVIFFVKRQSRFITFHALQVLLFQAVCLFIEMVVITGVFTAIGLGISFGTSTPQHTSNPPPLLFFLFVGLFMLGSLVLWLLKLLLAIIYGVKVGGGQWAEYPILGRLARKILNIGPGGTVATP